MSSMTGTTKQTYDGAKSLRRRRKTTEITKTLSSYFLLLLVMVIIVVPLMWSIAASFTPNEEVFEHVFPFSWRALFPSSPTLEAYVALFEQRDFGRAILNTLLLAFGSVFIGILISAMAGFAFAKFEFRGKNVLFVVLITLIPVEVIISSLLICGSVDHHGRGYSFRGLPMALSFLCSANSSQIFRRKL